MTPWKLTRAISEDSGYSSSSSDEPIQKEEATQDQHILLITDKRPRQHESELITLPSKTSSKTLELFRGHTWFLDGGENNALTKKKVLTRNRERTKSALAVLLQHAVPATINPKNAASSFVGAEVLNSGIASRPSNCEDDDFLEGASIFRTCKFTYPDSKPSQRWSPVQNVSFRQSTIKNHPAKRATSTNAQLSLPRNIHIVSGVCLLLKPILDKIKCMPVETFRQLNSPQMRELLDLTTLYDQTTKLMLSRCIANLIAMITVEQHKSHPPSACTPSEDNHCTISLTLDVPRVQYYVWAEEMLQSGHWSWQDGVLWTQIVDAKHDQAFTTFERTVREAVERSGGLCPCYEFRIKASNGAEAAEKLFKRGMREERLFETGEYLDALATQNEDANRWSLLQNSLTEKEVPTEKMDLTRLTYVFELLRPLLGKAVKLQTPLPSPPPTSSSSSASLSPPPSSSLPPLPSSPLPLAGVKEEDADHLILNIDDAFHFKIYERAVKTATRMGKSGCLGQEKASFLAAYPFNPVCLVTGMGRQNLWTYDQVSRDGDEGMGEEEDGGVEGKGLLERFEEGVRVC